MKKTADTGLKVAVHYGIEGPRVPHLWRVVEGGRSPVSGIFVVVAWPDVRVEKGVEVAVDAEIDAPAAGCGFDGGAEGGHVAEKFGLLFGFEVEELFDHGVREEEGIALQELGVAHHGETAFHAVDEGGILALGQLLEALGGSHGARLPLPSA